jgi:hypothetical protein
MTIYVSRMPAQPAVQVRIFETAAGWTGIFVGHLNRKFPETQPCETPDAAMQALWIKTSHLAIRPEDNRWMASLIGRLPN